MARWKSEEGQALVIVALGMVVLLAFLGLAVDMGSLRLAKRQVQAAADAAALAAAQELTYSDVTAAAQTDVQNNFNGATATVGTGPCPSASVSTLTVIVNHPPSCVATDPNKSNTNYVEVYVSNSFKTPFASIFGVTSKTITARAEAQGNLNCIYALEPSGTGVNAVLAYVTSDCGIVDESASTGFFSSALDCLFGYISAPYIGVVGGTTSFFCGGTTAQTGITLPSTPYDPLLYLQSTAPTPTSCGTSASSPYSGASNGLSFGTGQSNGTTATLQPGTYCGGINIAPGAHVTFTSGTFILTTKNPPTTGSPVSKIYGLTVDIGTTVTGTGVTFYNYGPAVSTGAGANNSAAGIVLNFTSFTSGGVSLSAPTSGSYPGILFFQAATNTAPATILGAFSFNTTLNGAYYFPNAPLTFVFDATTDYDPIVAKSITFALSGFSNCPSGSYSNCSGVSHNYPSGVAPLRQGGSSLVQ